MITVSLSILTSLIVSFVWSKWFMKQLEKWMEIFFKEESEMIKKLLVKDKFDKS